MHRRRQRLRPRLLARRLVHLRRVHEHDPHILRRALPDEVLQRHERDVEPDGRGVEREDGDRLRAVEGELPARPAVRGVEARDGERAPDVREAGRLAERRPAACSGKEKRDVSVVVRDRWPYGALCQFCRAREG